MKNYYQICLWLLFAIFSSVVRAQAELPKEAAFWQQMVAGSSPVKIAMVMRESISPWPKIEAVNIAPKWKIDLIMQLHAIIRQSFNQNATLQPEETNAYLQIADVLSKADGYSNILLADSIYKLVIFDAAKKMANSFDNIKSVESVITRMTVPTLKVKDRLKSFANDDPNLLQRVSAIDEIEDSDNLYVISQKLLSTNGREYVWTWSEDLTFSHLIANPSGLGLTFRIAQTEMLASVSLKAFLEFIKQGGTLSELDPADVTRFKKRMSNSNSDYRYPLLGKRRLSVDDLLGVLEISTDLNTKRAFLRTALE